MPSRNEIMIGGATTHPCRTRCKLSHHQTEPDWLRNGQTVNPVNQTQFTVNRLWISTYGLLLAQLSTYMLLYIQLWLGRRDATRLWSCDLPQSCWLIFDAGNQPSYASRPSQFCPVTTSKISCWSSVIYSILHLLWFQNLMITWSALSLVLGLSFCSKMIHAVS